MDAAESSTCALVAFIPGVALCIVVAAPGFLPGAAGFACMVGTVCRAIGILAAGYGVHPTAVVQAEIVPELMHEGAGHEESPVIKTCQFFDIGTQGNHGVVAGHLCLPRRGEGHGIRTRRAMIVAVT